MSLPISASSSVVLAMASLDLLPSGSSPFFFRGLRRPSNILRNAPLLARSPRNPSSSLSSILRLSTSTDGRRVAPCRPMPEIVSVSSAIFAPPGRKFRDNGEETGWFHRGGEWRIANGEWTFPIRYSPLAIRHFRAKSLIFGAVLGRFPLTWGRQRI